MNKFGLIVNSLQEMDVPDPDLPTLVHDDRLFGQSIAIARNLAKEHGLVGRNALEVAQAESLVKQITDFLNEGKVSS